MKVNPWANRPLYRNISLLESDLNEQAAPVEPDTDTPHQTPGGAGSDAQSQARPEARPTVAEAPAPAPLPAPPPAPAPVPAPPPRPAAPPAPQQRALPAPLDPGEPLDMADRLDFERPPRRSNAPLGPNAVAASPAPAPQPGAPVTVLISAPLSAANERPVDMAWLTQRQSALIGFRAEYDAARAGAEAGGVGFGRIGPGWVPSTLATDEIGRIYRSPGQIEVIDPTAEPVFMDWDDNGPVFVPASRTYEFDEAAFAAGYRARSAAQPSASLQALAAAYDTDAATLFTQRPELWSLATSDHALNAGAAPPGFAMGNAQQLGLTDLYLADPQIAALIAAYGSASPAPARSAIGLEQARLYGTNRSSQLTRLGTAMASVREQYSAALANAWAGGSTAGWVERDVPLYATDESGLPVGEPIGTGRGLGFDPVAFTAWYTTQPGLQHKAFGDFYGACRIVDTFENAGCVGDVVFDNSNWRAPSIGAGIGFSAMEHRELVSFALDGAPKLNDDTAVGFDFEAGWSTSQANLHQGKDWFFTVVQMVIMGTVAWASAGTLGPAVAGSMGMSTAAAGTAATAATLTTGGMIVSAAVVGASTSLVSGILNDNLSLKGVLRGALSGALTAGLLQGVGAVAGNLGTVGSIAARTTVQGAVQALLGGSFKDGAIAGFASGLADAVSVNMKGGIEKAFDTGAMTAAEATAARTFARLIGSAIRAAANPSDPGQAFASALLDDVFRQVDPRAPVSGSPVGPVLASNDVFGSAVTPNDRMPPATTPAPALAPAISPAPVMQGVYESAADVGGLASLDSQASADGVKYLGPDGRVYDAPQPPVVVIGRRMTADEAAAYDAASLRASTALASAALAGEVWTLEALLAQGARWFDRAVAGLGELASLVPEISLRTVGLGVSLLTLSGNAGQGVARLQITENQRFEKLPGALYGILQQRNDDGDWQTVKTGVRLWEIGNQRMALTDHEVRALNAPLTNPADPRQSPPLITPMHTDREQTQPLPGMTIDPPDTRAIPGYDALPPLTIDELLIERNSAEQRRFRNWLVDEARRVDPSFDPTGYDAHHAIPLKEFPRLDALRIKLAELGVDIDDPSINGVLLPRGREAVGTTPHGDTQNNPEYWRETLKRFEDVDTQDRALVVLAEMRSDLRDGKFVQPKPKGP